MSKYFIKILNFIIPDTLAFWLWVIVFCVMGLVWLSTLPPNYQILVNQYNEFTDFCISELEFTIDKCNIIWSGRK